MGVGDPSNQSATELSEFDEVHGGRVHAVAQTRRLRAVVENVSQVCVTHFARNRGALHTQASICNFNNIFARDRRPEAGPPGARLELRLRAKARRVAADATKEAAIVQVPGVT